MNLPPQCADLLTRWLVPLFLAYNIVGWWWLPTREVNRSHLRESYTKLNEQNLADLGRAFGGAWLVGLLVAIAIVAAISKFYPDLLQKDNLAPLAGYVAGSLGLLAGLVRGALATNSWFRKKPAMSQRRILSFGMIVAVGISVASIILYYSSGGFLRSLIAAGYFSMLIGYAVPYVLQVGK
jgi:uncharacterized membrane protein YwzB